MDPVLTIPVLVSHSRNQSSSIWQIEDPVQFQVNILETSPVLVEPLVLSDYWPFYFLYWPFYTRMHIYLSPRFDTCLKVAPSRLIHWISSYICGFVTLLMSLKKSTIDLVVSSNSLQTWRWVQARLVVSVLLPGAYQVPLAFTSFRLDHTHLPSPPLFWRPVFCRVFWLIGLPAVVFFTVRLFTAGSCRSPTYLAPYSFPFLTHCSLSPLLPSPIAALLLLLLLLVSRLLLFLLAYSLLCGNY